MTKRTINIDKFGVGVERFILGLGKKVLLANNIGIIWTTITTNGLEEISTVTSWIAIIAYTFQIYFDFSGYSDMAIGLGKMLGFSFMENFNYPYIATSITDFWRRWHISLSTWFKEYLYIPLGGNKKGVIKQCRNLIIVWALTGLWHGASYNFIIWGLYYGFLLIIEKFILKSLLNKLPTFIKWIYSIVLIMIGWVFFASPDLSFALDYINIMFNGGYTFIDATSYYYLRTNFVLFIILILSSTPILKYIFIWIKKQKEGGILLALIIQIAIIIIATAYLINASYNPFLYFRF